jgi:hypothetical protein
MASYRFLLSWRREFFFIRSLQALLSKLGRKERALITKCGLYPALLGLFNIFLDFMLLLIINNLLFVNK